MKKVKKYKILDEMECSDMLTIVMFVLGILLMVMMIYSNNHVCGMATKIIGHLLCVMFLLCALLLLYNRYLPLLFNR